MDGSRENRGPIAWMARNAVAANLAMLVLILGGALMLLRIKQEVFPELALDTVQVRVPYPGASPEEVEEGIIEAIEEEVRGLDGVKRVTSSALEGVGIVQVELLLGADKNKMLQDIKNGVDRITSFPEDAERPIVSVGSNRVIRVAPSGETELVLEDCDPGQMRALQAAFDEDRFNRDMIDIANERALGNLSSIAFGGPDLKTVFLGSLGGSRIATFRSPIAGAEPVHWTF